MSRMLFGKFLLEYGSLASTTLGIVALGILFVGLYLLSKIEAKFNKNSPETRTPRESVELYEDRKTNAKRLLVFFLLAGVALLVLSFVLGLSSSRLENQESKKEKIEYEESVELKEYKIVSVENERGTVYYLEDNKELFEMELEKQMKVSDKGYSYVLAKKLDTGYRISEIYYSTEEIHRNE